MDRLLVRRARDGEAEVDLLRVVHAHVEHHEENDEQEKGLEDGFEHVDGGLTPSATRRRTSRKCKVRPRPAAQIRLCAAAALREPSAMPARPEPAERTAAHALDTADPLARFREE